MGGVKACFLGAKDCPLRGLCHVRLTAEGLSSVLEAPVELVEALVVYPRMPFAVHLELWRSGVVDLKSGRSLKVIVCG